MGTLIIKCNLFWAIDLGDLDCREIGLIGLVENVQNPF